MQVHNTDLLPDNLELFRFFPNPLPRILHVPRLCVRLSHAEPQRQLAVQLRMREIQIAAAVQTVHDRLIRRVPAFVPESH